MKILVIEDEVEIQEILKNYLENEGYLVDLANDGVEGISKFQTKTYDLVLLDVMMPKIDGYVVLEMIRKESSIPVIMITAMGKPRDQIKAFNLDVDDYIVKPFEMELVLKRVEAVLRRSKVEEKKVDNVLKYKDLLLDVDSCEVSILGKAIFLTVTEYDLLKLFLENQNIVFSRDHLIEKIWGYDFVGEQKVVNTHIKNLRKKIGGDYIKTVHGRGYKIDRED